MPRKSVLMLNCFIFKKIHQILSHTEQGFLQFLAIVAACIHYKKSSSVPAVFPP